MKKNKTKSNTQLTGKTTDRKGSVNITAPLTGSIITQGQYRTVQLSYEPTNIDSLRDAYFILPSIGWFEAPIKAPFTTTVSLPDEIGPGNSNIVLLVQDSSGFFYMDTISVTLRLSNNLDSIEVVPGTVLLDSFHRQQSLLVLGHQFRQNKQFTYNITNTSAETKYTVVRGNSIIEIDNSGLITAIASGKDTIVVSNNGHSVKVPVLVQTSFLQRKKYQNIIDFPAVEDKTLGDDPIGLSASSSSGEMVIFSLVSGPASLKDGILTMLGPGRVSVKASQAGNVYYAPAQDVIQSFCINPVPPIITQSGSILISSAASGNQWYLNGAPIAGATNQQYTAQASGLYTVQVTQNGCSATSQTLNFAATGIVESTAWSGEVVIYPNPVQGVMNISNKGARKLKLQLVDATGRLVRQVQLYTVSGCIDTYALAQGYYLLIITDTKKNETVAQAIVKQ